VITSAQIRAARSLLGLSQAEVASRAGLSVPTIKRAESDSGLAVSRSTIEVIRDALEIAGVLFLAENGEGAGVRFKKPPAREALRPEELNAANDD
jgi:transcriptional regulator with XRE-family HTH domain